ncbi:hypothetical protein CICLE_v10010829mg [Citrus x clementina]|uniref:Uncharacterized protein n=2 Tax=Citrus TaxID=2706 RepID=V4WDI9_CITCL|nr:hypothetical protein CICLE_v10010829mg [Citrus x clementina]
MGLGSKIFLLLGLVITIVVLLTSTKVAAARNMAEASTATRKGERLGFCINLGHLIYNITIKLISSSKANL